MISQSEPQSKPMTMFSAPTTISRLLHCSDTMTIPKLPMSVPAAPIKEDAEPVSPFCCSNIRFVLGGRMQLPAIVPGNSAIAKIHGLALPNRHTNTPLKTIIRKSALIMAS